MPSIKNLVHQTSSSTGTGNLTLATVNGKQSFATAFGTGAPTDVFYYFISSRNAAEWEFGTGHMSDATTLVRDTIIGSSNSNSAVDFSTGTLDVVNDLPAEKQVNADDLADVATSGAYADLSGTPDVSGTNTGDQTITLTGDVTGSGTGSFAATIASGAVTLAKMANMATASLIYRKTAGSGAPEVNSLATLKTDLGLSGTNSGDQTTVTGNAGTATALATARAIYGNNFDGSAALTQIIASTYGGTGNGFTKFSGPASSEKTFTLPNSSQTVAMLDLAAQALSGGARITTFSNGTKSSGTFTPDPGNGPNQSATNNGAHTLAPGSNLGSYYLDYTNGASAGAITTSGFTKVDGDSFDTTNAHKFKCLITVSEIGSTLTVKAMQ